MVAATVAVAVAAGALGSIAAGAEEGTEVPESVFPYQFKVSPKQNPESHVFRLSILLDICPTPLLEVDHVTLVESPKSGSPKSNAIVTAYVRWGAHHELREGEPCPPEVPIKKEVRVRTRRPVSELVFFDGSSSPPRRVFPRPRQR